MGDSSRDLFTEVEIDSTLIVLVRHAQTTWNVDRRFQGQLDVPLSAVGLEQANALAEWISTLSVRFSAIYSSDLARAASTAKPTAEKLGLSPHYAEELRELFAGDWQGLTTSEVEERYPGKLEEWRTHIENFILPNGESVRDVQRRVSQYMEIIARRHQGEAIIVVSHGASLASYIAQVNGWDLQETWDSRRARMSNTGVTVLAISGEGTPRTLVFNSTAHLRTSPDLPSVMDREPGVDKRGSNAEYAL